MAEEGLKRLLVVFLTLFLILNVGVVDIFANENQNSDEKDSVVISNGITTMIQIFVSVIYNNGEHITL